MTETPLVLEFGMGVDVHGQDYTKAARRFVSTRSVTRAVHTDNGLDPSTPDLRTLLMCCEHRVQSAAGVRPHVTPGVHSTGRPFVKKCLSSAISNLGTAERRALEVVPHFSKRSRADREPGSLLGRQVPAQCHRRRGSTPYRVNRAERHDRESLRARD
jgi:hypothetical protein